MNVLLTGSEGFLGSNVCKYLDGDGDTVVRADCNAKYGVHIRQDLRDPWGEIKGVDACIHLASLYSAPNAPDESKYLVSHNVDLMERTLSECSKNGIRTLVVGSSSAVYGNEAHPKVESDMLNPLNDYGVSVMKAEALCSKWAKELRLTVISVRLFHVIGFNQSDLSLPWQIVKSAYEGSVLRVFGSSYRPWTYVGDVVRFLACCAQNGRRLLGTGHHIFNYSSTRVYSQLDLVDCVASITGKSPVLQIESPRLIDPPIVTPSIDKAICTFGSKVIPSTSLHVGMKEVVSCYLHERANKSKDEIGFVTSLSGLLRERPSLSN